MMTFVLFSMRGNPPSPPGIICINEAIRLEIHTPFVEDLILFSYTGSKDFHCNRPVTRMPKGSGVVDDSCGDRDSPYGETGQFV